MLTTLLKYQINIRKSETLSCAMLETREDLGKGLPLRHHPYDLLFVAAGKGATLKSENALPFEV
jgi:hypothetical protein